MPYRYRDDIALADVAFEAWGESIEEVFTAAADATTNVMVADLASIAHAHELTINLEREQLDLLLFAFLNELVFFKDAKHMLLRAQHLTITNEDSKYMLSGILYGETIDQRKHPLSVDVKAVTLHRFSLRKTDAGWEASVILDI